jgi:hypothetical protein
MRFRRLLLVVGLEALSQSLVVGPEALSRLPVAGLEAVNQSPMVGPEALSRLPVAGLEAVNQLSVAMVGPEALSRFSILLNQRAVKLLAKNCPLAHWNGQI